MSKLRIVADNYADERILEITQLMIPDDTIKLQNLQSKTMT